MRPEQRMQLVSANDSMVIQLPTMFFLHLCSPANLSGMVICLDLIPPPSWAK